MEQIDLAENTKLIIIENVLAVTSNNTLKTIGSAIFNGGCQQARAVLNVGVPEDYSDRALHIDPLQLIKASAVKIGVTSDYVAMVTAAKIKNYSLVCKKTGEYSVCVVATAGCSHGESSGEEMDVQEIAGTINQIVFIDGNPTESCMVAALITATEAKSAVLRDYDVRSRYTGDSATGSITDSVTVVATGTGKTITLSGPASRLGKTVGYCARCAVKEALLKQEPEWKSRSVLSRLKERQLSLEKIAAEVSKIEGLVIKPEDLGKVLKENTNATGWLLAATKMDDDYKKNLLPTDFESWEEFSRGFGSTISTEIDYTKAPKYDQVDLPPFLKAAIIQIVQEALKRKVVAKS